MGGLVDGTGSTGHKIELVQAMSPSAEIIDIPDADPADIAFAMALLEQRTPRKSAGFESESPRTPVLARKESDIAKDDLGVGTNPWASATYDAAVSEQKQELELEMDPDDLAAGVSSPPTYFVKLRSGET